jgi:hypothetical protein
VAEAAFAVSGRAMVLGAWAVDGRNMAALIGADRLAGAMQMLHLNNQRYDVAMTYFQVCWQWCNVQEEITDNNVAGPNRLFGCCSGLNAGRRQQDCRAEAAGSRRRRWRAAAGSSSVAAVGFQLVRVSRKGSISEPIVGFVVY